ncbi:NAD(P)/FAD-dependent oxidoreductase [Nocardiopsis sp. RSe5-2]|uniref:NAD(P)/FAD-dependent oxidoreductase n=1 Tax=Nocardiopsis endophytica TaxID=3018445 RepID=A0ABT4UBI1_9ACTN|nr:NAD(P)/FAD-dependent oxidoreductase [Nocardiopsis endophytica]MDA2814337.1 NAD(P)/FAD-dependent oxidoreductase [Nocardiopsis endophytica]
MTENETTAPHYRVAVIGSGFSGIGMAARLKRAGLTSLVLLERAHDVGGTWRDNTFPGAACDVPSHLYSLSFRLNPGWSRTFSGQEEIQAYLQRVAEEEDVYRHVRFGFGVSGTYWEPAANRWRIESEDGRTVTAQFLISACGALADPSVPDIPGLADFQGTVFHSARWDHSHDLSGRSVAVIGTGASAIQFVPQIQPKVGRLDLYQRTPPWVIPKHDRDVTRLERWLFHNVPGAQQVFRKNIYWGRETYVLGFVKYPALMKGVAALAKAHLKRQVKDPELRAKLVPDFVPGCKRLLLSNDYYPSLDKPNVEVVTDGIKEIREKSVLAADGTEREVDTIIFGTGFHVTDMPAAKMVHDAEGRSIWDRWGDDLESLKGTTVSGYPNLFILAGPNTGPGHTSHVFFLEAQMRYVMSALRFAARNRVDRLEALPEAQTAYSARMQHKTRDSVWVTGGCDSWYLNSKGRNVTLWPGFSFEYALQTLRFDPHNYRIRKEVPRSARSAPNRGGRAAGAANGSGPPKAPAAAGAAPGAASEEVTA